jgi:uracil-DNA glycosylase
MISPEQIKLEESWKLPLMDEFQKPYMQKLRGFLQDEIQTQRKMVFPRGSEIFSALDYTPLDKVKVVILGQDPYHGEGQAHGLCFSVKPGVKTPPSLQNIYKEMATDLGIKQPAHGYLESWAKQGVLLLNSVLTVENGKAASHQNRGWETFTDRIVAILNQRDVPTAFVLWGAYAQRKGAFIDTAKHLVLKAPHPSPLSAYHGFFGCRHFSKINEFLTKNNQRPINWQLPELNASN